ncbi:ABC-type transport system permease protein [Natrialba magadii ATCC 43099]|uniref:ABC-type transport system permease protein n=1 Tax=Natrialba magadii (strain ATCC 43099 / DSM 3394 / CCM 3739 / CIP 104546 / IAM 13178 / JCM 8861 / NBRC 102185 / NCIMB 2190 / MS3) TaxID=547559 RepID=D3SWQ9_NATMM|nr:ABC transporter permease subunit [Natrialba magadii]ADD05791.1 ABC-type transport system permease protein [Natrialba magadii ATCC 43099]ELY30133.1 hypothetical protein C500_09274 [Natrialba magadii ATCC 43099]
MSDPAFTTEIRLLSRSRAVWICWLAIAALLVAAVFGASPPRTVQPVDVHPILFVLFENVESTYEAVIRTYFTALLLLPLVAFVHSYGAIVEERETGRLRVALTMPCSRRRLYGAILAARSVTFLVPLFVALLIAGIALASAVGANALRPYGYVVLAACLLALACVSIGVAISAGASTSNRAVGALFVVYAGLLVIYPIGLLRSPLPYGLLFLNPLFASTALMTNASPHIGMPGAVDGSETGMIERETIPFYLSDPFLVLVLLGWTIVAALIGRWLLTRTDL